MAHSSALTRGGLLQGRPSDTFAPPDFAKIVGDSTRKACPFVSGNPAVQYRWIHGKLTLNVLLSFAQFEREVTGERIRDKIAASKKKGM